MENLALCTNGVFYSFQGLSVHWERIGITRCYWEYRRVESFIICTSFGVLPDLRITLPSTFTVPHPGQWYSSALKVSCIRASCGDERAQSAMTASITPRSVEECLRRFLSKRPSYRILGLDPLEVCCSCM